MNKFFKNIALGVGTLMTFCLFLTPLQAAGSIQANGSTYGEVYVNGKLVDGSTSEFHDDFSFLQTSNNESDAQAYDEIVKMNAGESIADVLSLKSVKLPKDSKMDLREYSLLTRIQDLQAFESDGTQIKENATVTWEVPNLKEDLGDVFVLHYSTERSLWEVIEPDSVDYANKRVTATFEDLSPVAVIYKSSDSVKEEGTGPDTSTSTNTGLYIGVAAVAIVAGGALVYRSKKKN